MKRIDQIIGPLVVGRRYLVPTVRGEWYGVTRDWPVIGPRHNDTQCLRFESQHYHFDARFMAEPAKAGPTRKWGSHEQYWISVFGAPLMTSVRMNAGGLPSPVWRVRTCRRLGHPFRDRITGLVEKHNGWQCHFDQWAGKQARHDGAGWVCPHRSVRLADHAVVDGVITCPLHLLRIDAATGVVLPQTSRERAA